MQNDYYTMDDLKNETTEPPAPSSIAYDEPPTPSDAPRDKIVDDLMGKANDVRTESAAARNHRIAVALADLVFDMKARGANGLIIGGVLITRLPDNVSPGRVMQDMQDECDGVNEDEGEGSVLNVVEQFVEDTEMAVLSCAAEHQTAAVINRTLRIGEDTNDVLNVSLVVTREAV